MTTPLSADDGQGVGGKGNDGEGSGAEVGGGGAGGGGPKPAHKEPLPKFDTVFRGDTDDKSSMHYLPHARNESSREER